MFRPQTKQEARQDRTKSDQKQQSNWQVDKSTYLAPDYIPSGNSRQAAAEYDDQIALERAVEQHERWEEEQAALKKQTLQEEIERAKQSGEELMSAAQYYELAVSQRDGSGDVAVNKPGAAQTFWTALICGEGRAAFDLFQMLYNGDGIAQNEELARPLWSVANRLDDQRAAFYKGKIGLTVTTSNVGIDIYAACKKAANLFESGINPAILQIQTRLFNEILESKNDDLLTADLAGHTMFEYLVTVSELPQVQLTGHSEHSNEDDCCCAIL